jgi:hypothetical protein
MKESRPKTMAPREPGTAPGIPPGYPDPQRLVTADCIRPAEVTR